MTPSSLRTAASSTPVRGADLDPVAGLVARCLEALESEADPGCSALLDAAPRDLARQARARLETLRAAGLLHPPEGIAPAAPDLPPTGIEPYRIRAHLGTGGMGEVYLAWQDEPVQRHVAIKLIKRGMDSRAVLARFELERQALARMTHPNIARVFDAGMAADGRPFFVLEHVPGRPLVQYCDERRLPTAQRLALLIQVCHAVQHAHHKGVIHRDLKPGNILVAEEDGRAIPKIIDFGVAKAVAQPLVDATAHTLPGHMVGTPEYMSPEQATLGELDVDSRTDVYALGVILYELLTGTLPFASSRLRAAGVEGMLHIIRGESPARPSTRVTPGTDSARQQAAARATDPVALRRGLRGDLDWVVLKALEKDRNRRYSTPDDLAADLRRHLAHEVVAARPPSSVYRMSRFVRRHRIPVAAAAVALLALLSALGVSMTFSVAARRALVAESAARSGAERSFALTCEVVDRFLVRVAEMRLKDEVQTERVRRELLTDALEHYGRLLAQHPDVGVAARLARARTLVARMHLLLGAFAEAEAESRQAVETLTELRSRTPDAELDATLGDAQLALGSVWLNKDRLADATDMLQRSVATLERLPLPGPHGPRLANALASLGLAKDRTGRHEESAVVYRRAVDTWLALQAAYPSASWARGVVRARIGLARALAKVGREADAESELGLAVEQCDVERGGQTLDVEAHRDLRDVWTGLGLARFLARRWPESAQAYQAAIEAGCRILAHHPGDLEAREKSSRLHGVLATVQAKLGRHEASMESARAAIAGARSLVADHPDHSGYRLLLTSRCSTLAQSLLFVGRRTVLGEAEQHAREALDVAEHLPHAVDEAEHVRIVASCQQILAYVIEAGGGPAGEAVLAWQKAIAAQSALLRLRPGNLGTHGALADAYVRLAALRLAQGDTEAAAGALDLSDATNAAAPEPTRETRRAALLATRLRGLLAVREGDHAAATALAGRILELDSGLEGKHAAAEVLTAAWPEDRTPRRDSAPAERARHRAESLLDEVVRGFALAAGRAADLFTAVTWGKAAIALAELQAARGAHGEARELLRRALARLRAIRDEVHADRWDELLFRRGFTLLVRCDLAAGEAGGSERTIDDLMATAGDDPEVMLQAACLHGECAQAAAGDPERAAHHVEAALARLCQAADSGIKGRARIASLAELRPLHDRDAFSGMLARIPD